SGKASFLPGNVLSGHILPYYRQNPNRLKKVIPLLILSACTLHNATAQIKTEEVDTSLHAQKDNVITASTVIKIENLGVRVNSDLAELRPTVSADGKLLFFICENHPANTKYQSVPNSQDIWYSEKDTTGKWSEARHLGYPLNTM